MSYHVPMCVICGEKEVAIVVNSTGAGYCSTECEASYNEAEGEYDAPGDGWADSDIQEMYGEAEMARWDDDPSPYDGTYSEE